jgi:tripartite-type tricarboxylate transporter receptor subunit TctC
MRDRPPLRVPSIKRRLLLRATVAGLAAPSIIHAQGSWPNRPIRFVVPLGPGGATDIVMRILAPKIGQILGTSIVVENRVGSGGVVGTDNVAKSPPDGYSFVHAAVASVVIAQTLFARLPFDPEKDLTAISPTVFVPLCLSVTKHNFNVTSLAELTAELRARPGQLSFASNGTGATSHLAGANLLRLTNTRAEHVPYRSGAEAVTALLTGDVQFAFDIPALHGPYYRDGRIRTIMASPERQPLIPDVPNNTEAGLPELKAYSWFGIFGPANLPPEITQRMHAAMSETLTDPAIHERLEQSGMPAMTGYSLDRFNAFIAEERVFWPPIVRASGASAQ